MKDRNYQTIDPLLLETLNLNQKRIHHIFDILHGRNPRSSQTQLNAKNNSTLNSSPSSKLPRIFEDHQKIKNPRGHVSSARIKKDVETKTNLESSPRNKSVLDNIQEKRENNKDSRVRLVKQRKSKSVKQPTPTIQIYQQQIKEDKKGRLMQDYGMNQIRKNKSLQINPKDVYRIQMQSLVSKLTEIDELQDAQKLMKRMKRRYQHLRKFDKGYYSKLTQSDLIFL